MITALHYIAMSALLLGLYAGEISWAEGACSVESTNAHELTSKQLANRATTKPKPELPAGFGRIDATISINVLVDADGKVVSAHGDLQAQPILRGYCEQAARKRGFKPLVVTGKPAMVRGPIIFHVKR